MSNSKAIVKLSRTIQRDTYVVRINPELLNKCWLKVGVQNITKTDVVNFCLYKFLMNGSSEDLEIFNIESDDLGHLRGAKRFEDSQKCYIVHQELLKKCEV